jgi:hypothetical protein
MLPLSGFAIGSFHWPQSEKSVPDARYGSPSIHAPGSRALLRSLWILEQSSVGIRGRFMGLVRPLLLVKVDLSSWSGWLPLPLLPPKAFLTGPSVAQRPIHREMFIRHVRPRMFQHSLKKRLRDLFVQQTISILAVHRVIPDRLVHLHPHKPLEQHVVLELLDQ